MIKIRSINGQFSSFINERGEFRYKLSTEEIMSLEKEENVSIGLFELFIYKTLQDKKNKIKSHINNASFIFYQTLNEMSPFDKGDTNIDTFFIPRYNAQAQCDLYIFQNPYKKTDTVNNNNFKIIIFTSASYSKDDITNNITYISKQLQSLYSIVDLSQAIVSIISFPSFISTYETQLLSLKICLTGIKSINIEWYINSLMNTPIDSGYLAELKSNLYPELQHTAMSYYEEKHSSNVTPVKQGINYTIKEIPISYNKPKHKSISPPIYSRKIPQISSVRNKNDKERNTAMIYQRANIEFKPYKKKIIKGGELSTNNTTLNATVITNEIKEVRIPLPSNRNNYSRKHSDDFNGNYASNMSFAEPSNHLMLNSTDLNISNDDDDDIMKREPRKKKEKKSVVKKLEYKEIEDSSRSSPMRSLKESQHFPCAEQCGGINCIVF